jgi:hypothetical protein
MRWNLNDFSITVRLTMQSPEQALPVYRGPEDPEGVNAILQAI